MHSSITGTVNLELRNSEKKKNLYIIIHTDFLEFVATKFNLNLIFVKFFLTKNKNQYSIRHVWKYKIYIVFRTNATSLLWK